ncbi:hypothetical protein [Calothrix sp. 336/3]|uniref:hypothetical protein n=1 Tax=Calothrix sp. 336/3 TaxID=1337936 RepID=UPI0004E3B683|nr:hypothetical protein [Calothrix sp. 336/3]AKG21050.1 hypothetical protein IJ00_06830 [Calothrix sp. 336/3]
MNISNNQYSPILPPWKFYTLSLFTWGFYQVPWAHKQWKYLKERENLNINPWLRAIFLPLYIYDLSQKAFALAEEEGYRKKYSPLQTTIFYWIFFFLLWWGGDTLSWVGLFSFLPLLRVLKTMNYYWQRQLPDLPVNESFTVREMIWIGFGVMLWLMIIYSGISGSSS